MQSIFPNGNNLGQGNSTKILCSFNAGKMNVEERSSGSYWITPDERKGKISLLQKDQNIVHFQWVNRETNAIIDDFTLVKDEVSYKKVKTGRDGDRVYLLECKNGPRYFYWLQNKDSSKDVEQFEKVKKIVADPQHAPAVAVEEQNPGAVSDTFMRILNALNANEGGAAATSGSHPATQSPPSNIAVDGGLVESNAIHDSEVENASDSMREDEEEDMTEEEMLRRAIEESMKDQNDSDAQGDHPNDSAGKDNTPNQGASSIQDDSKHSITAHDLHRAMQLVVQQGGQNQYRLEKIFTKDNIQSILSSSVNRERLLPLLPEQLMNQDELNQTIYTPQFRQCLGTLSHALESNDPSSILANLGLSVPLDQTGQLHGDPVLFFLRAIQASINQKK